MPDAYLSGNQQETRYLKRYAHDGTRITSIGRAAKRDSSVGIAGLILTEVSTEAGGGGCLGGWWAPTALKHSACPLGHTPPSVSPKHKHKTQNTKHKTQNSSTLRAPRANTALPSSVSPKHRCDGDHVNCQDCKIDDEDDLMIALPKTHCHVILLSIPT